MIDLKHLCYVIFNLTQQMIHFVPLIHYSNVLDTYANQKSQWRGWSLLQVENSFSYLKTSPISTPSYIEL